MPNGGEEHVINNLIAQGTYNGGQRIMVEFGAEGLQSGTQSLELTGNILIDDLGIGTFLNLFAAPSSPAQIQGNTFIGASTTEFGGAAASSVTQSGNQSFTSRSQAGITAQFPTPAGCTGPIGNVAVQ